MSAGFKVVIPARYGSVRLPGKPLRLIAGKPMIAHVCSRAQEAGADAIIVATDNVRIMDAVSALGIKAVMTSPNHSNGTERIAEVARQMAWPDSDIIVNLQGDEPLLPASYIMAAAQVLASQQQAGIATLAAPIQQPDEIFNPNAVKVVLDKNGYALYFSRAAIPWERDAFANKQPPSGKMAYLRHIGLYAYTVGFLHRYCQWPVSVLEGVESLEQLRILWQGEKVIVRTVATPPPAGVDTEEDLQRAEAELAKATKGSCSPF
jgi:3-deoxy-manno-octulosonate cytidylyltransferase (CMP-KDO synthetase)